MTLETAITIQMISIGICIGVCLIVMIGAALDAIMSKKPDKSDKPESPQPEKTKWYNNFVVCACKDCVHHDIPALGLQCGKHRTFITSDGNCRSYVPRDRKIAK